MSVLHLISIRFNASFFFFFFTTSLSFCFRLYFSPPDIPLVVFYLPVSTYLSSFLSSPLCCTLKDLFLHMDSLVG